jgi:2TM domain
MEKENKDPGLWKIAQKRAGFKYHLLIYSIVNIFFWVLWYTTHRNNVSPGETRLLPWPLWPMFGWGIGVFFNYLSTYTSANRLAEREYQKLTNKQ